MTTLMNRWMALLLVGVFAWAGCAETAVGPLDDGKPDEAADSGGKEDRWDWRNNPDRFGGTMVTELAQLPSEGRTAQPAWPSTYWATYEDSIQARWNGEGELSPAEKYDRAFNGWTPSDDFMSLRRFTNARCTSDEWDREYYTGGNLGPLAQHVSDNMGNIRARDGRDSDGDEEIDECGDHDGVQTWFGLCHAWVPAAMLEAAPQRSVTYNGVEFHTGDMEALLIATYNRGGADMIGGRCNVGNEESEPVERDEFGRAINIECRDTNPGSLHIILTNFLGIQHRAFAEDRTYDYQVWNQPVVAYNITRQDEITIARANELLGVTGDTYQYNADAAQLFDVKVTVTYITESYASTTPADPSRYERNDNYSYILEVDSNGDVIGGEWYGNSRRTHPDFLWSPRRITRSSVPYLDIDNVRMLIQMSTQPLGGGSTGGDTPYLTNANTPIPDNNPAGITSTLNVSESGAIEGLQVELNITHTYIGDLKVTLSHNGIDRVIHNNAGGSSDNIQSTITVGGFDGVGVGGNWTLKVVDSAGQDTGTLVSWKLIPAIGGGGTSTGGNNATMVSVSGSGNISIPDNNNTGVTSIANVSQTFDVDRVQVELDITHTYVSDLMITLSHGVGENTHTAIIHNRSGADSDNIDATIDVTGFESHTSSGPWTLAIQDLAGQDVGTLNSWTLRVYPEGTSSGGGTTTTGPQQFPGQGGISIPDNNPTGITSVAGVPSTVTSGTVAIAVNITHTYRGDLTVSVVHGNDDPIMLHEQEGGGTDNLVQTYPLSTFSGSPAGTWTLSVSDNAGQDVGELVGWSVIVTP